MKIKAFIATIVLCIMTTIGIAAIPAHAITPNTVTLGSGWTSVSLHAFSGGGCALYSGTTIGSVWFSEPCTYPGQEDVQARIVTDLNSGSNTALEIALPAFGIALTVNNGQWKWEAANSNTTVFPLDNGPYSQGNNYYYALYQAGDHYMGPNGKTLPLKDIAPSGNLNNAGWTWQPPL